MSDEPLTGLLGDLKADIIALREQLEAERRRAFAAEGELAFLKNAHDTRIERLEAALREIAGDGCIFKVPCSDELDRVGTRRPHWCHACVAARALGSIRMPEPCKHGNDWECFLCLDAGDMDKPARMVEPTGQE